MATVVTRHEIEGGLLRALRNDELVLHYQPLVSLVDHSVVGLEALVRWEHPERGLLGPNEFIGIAEASGLLVPLTHWVLGRACRDARTFMEHCEGPVRVAVNVPPVLLSHADLASRVYAELERNSLPPSALGIELVESSVLETHPVVMSNLRQLRELGVRIAVDDFGTGYSSFSYLKTLPIHYLKLDRSFTHRLPTDRADGAICQALVSMANELNLIAVAEGVETAEQARFLQSIGCRVAQGYHFSRPLAADACLAFLRGRLRGDVPSVRSA